jgi:ribonuclease G
VDSNLNKIIVDSKEQKEYIEGLLKEIGKEIKVEIDENVIENKDIPKLIKSIQGNKIWLKSGAFITIDKTEALVAIDVNSGKFTGKNDVEETITTVNIEAAREISKQIRLRDISGIIIIDFIDMKEDADKQAVIEEIKKCSKKDRSKVQVEEFTKLNLMEITRKHINSKKNF